MRNAIRNKIINNVTALKQVYQPSMPTKDSEKPYAVVKMESEIRTELPHSFNREIQVWIYDNRSDFNDLDSIAESIIDCLTSEDIITANNKVFHLTCLGIGVDDYPDPELEAVTKRIDFEYSFIRRY